MTLSQSAQARICSFRWLNGAAAVNSGSGEDDPFAPEILTYSELKQVWSSFDCAGPLPTTQASFGLVRKNSRKSSGYFIDLLPKVCRDRVQRMNSSVRSDVTFENDAEELLRCIDYKSLKNAAKKLATCQKNQAAGESKASSNLSKLLVSPYETLLIVRYMLPDATLCWSLPTCLSAVTYVTTS
ncbi:MAG: hypothetical protein EOP09_13645 [Proteobacteria bacterium]|nr:MAG: hypothetical protein EOP09_13645 [Pseudomonadota bacterium]